MTAPQLHVLLVEDEAMNRALVRAIVARQVPRDPGLVLLEADTIAAARRILESEPVDALLLDVRLPDGSGLRLAEEIRTGGIPLSASPTGERPLIAILSASVLTAEREAAETSGADAFLGKPFAPRDLVDLLSRFAAIVAARRTDPSTD